MIRCLPGSSDARCLGAQYSESLTKVVEMLLQKNPKVFVAKLAHGTARICCLSFLFSSASGHGIY